VVTIPSPLELAILETVSVAVTSATSASETVSVASVRAESEMCSVAAVPPISKIATIPYTDGKLYLTLRQQLRPYEKKS